jgi:hypothetical protein
VDHHGHAHQVLFRRVRAVFDLSRIERGPGEKLLLQEKIKQGDRVFEKGSRQTIARVSNGLIHFESGLWLRADDGRVRQGDCLTDYKAQGIKGAQVRGIEDNGSAMAMANKEAFHVKGTRHVQNLVLHVENKGLYLEAIQRSNVKFSALELERVPDAPKVALPPVVNKSRLLSQMRSWGKEFFPCLSVLQRMDKIRRHLVRFESLRPRQAQVMAEKVVSSQEKLAPKVAPPVQESVTQKVTPPPSPTPREQPREGLSSPAEEMAPQPNQPPRLRPDSPALQPQRSPFYVKPATRPQPGRGFRM